MNKNIGGLKWYWIAVIMLLVMFLYDYSTAKLVGQE